MKRASKLNKIIFAGDRDISIEVLKFIISKGVKPLALMIPNRKKASRAEQLISLCNHLDASHIIEGPKFKTKEGINLLTSLKPDYIISIHYPYIYPAEVLKIPKHGAINLHPAYLPYTKGWHTPSWAIWEQVPFGATLHFMDETLDTGDIIYQKKVKILHEDTANSVYKKAKKIELEVFKKSWSSLISGTYTLKSQIGKTGSFHKKNDLALIQKIDLEKNVKAKDLIRKLKALTTSDIKEAAYFKTKNLKYRIQIRIIKENNQSSD